MAAAVIIGIGHGFFLGHRNPDQSLAMGIISQHAPSSGTGRKIFNMVDGERGTD